MPESSPPLVVCNTSPLFYLHRIGQIDLLRRLYGTTIVPRSVLEELLNARTVGEETPDVASLEWVQVRDVSVPTEIGSIVDLGKGEASVIAVGLEERESALLILDDRLGREIAGQHGLRISGTAGVLLKSKRAGLIPSVTECLDAMLRAGFHLRKLVYDDIRSLAGE